MGVIDSSRWPWAAEPFGLDCRLPGGFGLAVLAQLVHGVKKSQFEAVHRSTAGETVTKSYEYGAGVLSELDLEAGDYFRE